MTQQGSYYPTLERKTRERDLGMHVAPTDADAALHSRVPQFTDPRKAEYLVLRSVNFTHPEALKSLELSEGQYQYWLDYDEMFRDWASGQGFRELQSSIGDAVLRAKFMRCVFLQLGIDSRIMTKKMFEPDSLTAEDKDELKEASKRYSAPNIASMARVLGQIGEEDAGRPVTLKLEVTLDGAEVSDYLSKKVAARQLLSQFSGNHTIIEGESIEVSDEGIIS